MPMPVDPAMAAGIHPPLGVTDTTHPSASAAWMDVVPAVNPSSNVLMMSWLFGRGPTGKLPHFPRMAWKGFLPPWNGYGSPGFASGSFLSQLIVFARAAAYSFDSSPLTGSSGAKSGSP